MLLYQEQDAYGFFDVLYEQRLLDYIDELGYA